MFHDYCFQSSSFYKRFYDRYEAEHFAYSEEGMKCAEASVNKFEERWFTNHLKKGHTFLFANFDYKLRRVFPLNYSNPIKSLLIKKYIGFTGTIKKMRKHDPTLPLYVEDAFNPKRLEKPQRPEH